MSCICRSSWISCLHRTCRSANNWAHCQICYVTWFLMCMKTSATNLVSSSRTSAWDGTRTLTVSCWRGWWGRNWNAASPTTRSHRSATHSPQLPSAPGPVRPPPCPPTAWAQTGAATCDDSTPAKREKKKLSTGNVPAAGWVTEIIFSWGITKRRWQNQTHFTSNTLMHWKWVGFFCEASKRTH